MFKFAMLGCGLFSGIAIASVGAMTAANSAAVDQNTLIPVGVLLTGIGVTVAVTWRVAKERNAIETKLVDLRQAIADLNDRMAMLENDLGKIMKTVKR